MKQTDLNTIQTISNYLRFSSFWLLWNKYVKTREYYKIREASQFFDVLLKALVYELHFKKELMKENVYYDLLQEVGLRVEKFDIDTWVICKELGNNIDLNKIEQDNIKTVLNVYENLDVKNILMDIEEMKVVMRDKE